MWGGRNLIILGSKIGNKPGNQSHFLYTTEAQGEALSLNIITKKILVIWRVKLVPEKIKWLKIERDRVNDWIDFCPENSFKVAKPDEILDFLPAPLRTGYAKKLDTSIIINKVAPFNKGFSSATYVIADLHRLDKGGYVIDQDPYVMASVSGEDSPRPSGAFFLHGEWGSRTFEPDWSLSAPNQVLSNIYQSGIDRYYPTPTRIYQESGPISKLDNTIYQNTIEYTLKKINPLWKP